MVGSLVKNQGISASKATLINKISDSEYFLSYFKSEIMPIAKHTVQVNPVDHEPEPPPLVHWAINTTAVVSVHKSQEKAWGFILSLTVL